MKFKIRILKVMLIFIAFASLLIVCYWPVNTVGRFKKPMDLINNAGNIDLKSQNDFIFWEPLSMHLLSIAK